jgi:anion-transporting  ArsA/GET3 family ATPase
MKSRPAVTPLTVVVGPGGVGKTTYAAALALDAARGGSRALVMTFDPSRRLKDSLGVGEVAENEPVRVDLTRMDRVREGGTLDVSLLNARKTFDRIVHDYAPDETAAKRILTNRYYTHLSGSLAGILEYMGVETLYEARREGRWDRIVLDTPPTAQALEFLEAPERMVEFLDSGAAKMARREWFDKSGRLRLASMIPFLGKAIEARIEAWIGLGLARDVAEFLHSFGPLYDGFKERALAVQSLLRAEETGFHLVTGAEEERIPESMFFARHLESAGYRLDRLILNRTIATELKEGRDAHLTAFRARAARHRRGREIWAERMPDDPRLLVLPELPQEPADLPRLDAMLRQIQAAEAGNPLPAFESMLD